MTLQLQHHDHAMNAARGVTDSGVGKQKNRRAARGRAGWMVRGNRMGWGRKPWGMGTESEKGEGWSYAFVSSVWSEVSSTGTSPFFGKKRLSMNIPTAALAIVPQSMPSLASFR